MAAQDIGRMLMGLSAGIQGRGTEFMQGQQRQQMIDQEHSRLDQERKRKAELERMKTVFKDSQGALKLGEQGRFDLIGQMGRERIDILGAMGVDSGDTQKLTAMADAAATGDVQAQKTLMETLANNVSIGRGLGVLEQPKIKQQIIDGKLVTIGADGVTASPIQGLETKPSKAEDLKLENLRLKNAKARQDLSALTQKPVLEAGDIRAIQKDFTSLIQEPTQIRNAAARLTKLGESKSPTDQLAAVFTFMKSLDPTSVVREGEQQQARSTGGLADEMVGYVNQIQGGGSLPPDVFNNMINTAKRLSNQATIDSRAQVTDWVDTFGETLPARVREKTLGRIPSLFKMDTKTPVAGGGQGAPARSEADILNQYGIQ